MSVSIAIIGATGLVGQEALQIILEKKINYDEIFLFASSRSVGNKITVLDKEFTIKAYDKELFKKINYVILATSAEHSIQYYNDLKDFDCYIIDNSSAFRMNSNVPLVIPEVNFNDIKQSKLIANPNCSTIILLKVLNNLKGLISRIDVSTYQAVSGKGVHGFNELDRQTTQYVNNCSLTNSCFDTQCLFNVFPACSNINNDGYNSEELKIINETEKIFKKKIDIFPTCIRVPTFRSHVESVTLTFTDMVSKLFIIQKLKSTNGIKVIDSFPEPIMSQNKDEVFVGSFRQQSPQTCQFVISGDQIRIGAALNAVNIIEKLITH